MDSTISEGLPLDNAWYQELNVQTMIRQRREQLGLTRSEVATRAGLDDHTYTFHMESEFGPARDEFFEYISVGDVKAVCRVLGLRLSELLPQEPLSMHPQASGALPTVSRPALIRSRREALGLTPNDLGDRLGYYSSAIEALESSEESLDMRDIDFLHALATVLGLPLAALVGN
jgi:transcriptional regulator with XRE-family HTH domain